MSMAYLRLGNVEEALKTTQKAIEVNPNYASSYLLLGQIYQQKNNLTEAVKALETAVKIDPQLAEGHIVLAQMLALQKNKDGLEHAKRHAQLALQIKPDHKETALLIDQLNKAITQLS